MSSPKTHSRLPSSSGFDHLVYLRIFEGCNLHCKHCFIPSNPRRMSLEDIRNVPKQLEGKVPTGARVLIQWHGGEPTLMGRDFISSAIDLLKSSTDEFSWRHGIQTNLMNYDKNWADLYRRHFGGEVGISWDPKIRLLNRHALDSHEKVRETFDGKLKNLLDDGLTPYLVVTAARTLFEAFTNPFHFFDYWADRGVKHIHLERITETGFARENWNLVGLKNREYSDFMSKWLRAYSLYKKNESNSGFFLSPFEDILSSIESLRGENPQGSGCWSGNCDTRFHTIDADGYKRGCTALTSEIGNKNAIPQLQNNAPFEKTRELRTYNCGSCEFRKVCSSGCLALSFDDGSGECSGGYSFFKTASDLLKEV